MFARQDTEPTAPVVAVPAEVPFTDFVAPKPIASPTTTSHLTSNANRPKSILKKVVSGVTELPRRLQEEALKRKRQRDPSRFVLTMFSNTNQI